ncbi:hypothetical protein AAEI02_23065, partial [Shewanella xiamenensis]|uniref:hypothetical protein n=1 Tax=Shewanella xiamenensis TaxID=332186 RepID=UPI00313A891C
RELDLNQRPSGYEPDELPCCSIPRPSNAADNCFNSVILELVAGAGFEPTTFAVVYKELSPTSYFFL